MSLEDFHESSGGSEDGDGVLNEVLRDAESGQGGTTAGESSKASFVDPLLDENQDNSNSHEHQQHNPNQLPQQPYADLARNSVSMFPQSSGADQISLGGFSSTSQANKQIVPSFTPTDRSLPSRDVTDETLDDAYVAFILYCNPSIPLDCDSTELRKAFRLPPKSDGKTFNVYELLQLIMKLEQKEIKTWTKLAIELGVERTPDQSTQKVQQYAVRLKRWMHAMHIDAFFEYCLGKAHSYYLQIPPVGQNGGFEEVRDGVPLEEDLALRALHPESRPKRGRRKTEDRNEDGSEKDLPTSKRHQLDPSTPATADATSAIDHYHGSLYPGPHSAAPSSADVDGMERYLSEAVTPEPWSANASALGGGGNSGQQFRWRAFSREATTPQNTTTPILTLETPTDDPMTPTITTPMSATPKSRSRRRHGSSVSSAWPSSGNPLTGKLRGRPPSNRSMRDGPFSTFPVNPFVKSGLSIDLGGGATGTPTSTPTVTSHPQQFQNNLRPQARPSGLHLQVPPRKPSTVTVATPITPQMNGSTMLKTDTAIEGLERAFAANLLHGTNFNLSFDEARTIARQVIADLRKPSGEQGIIPESDLLSTLKHLLGCESSTTGIFTDFRVQKIRSSARQCSINKNIQDASLARFRLTWRLELGPLKGKFTQAFALPNSGDIQQNCGLFALEEEEDIGDEAEDYEDFGMSAMANNGTGGDINTCTGTTRDRQSRGDDVSGNDFEWQKKYFEMEKRLREKEDEIALIKRKVLHAVM